MILRNSVFPFVISILLFQFTIQHVNSQSAVSSGLPRRMMSSGRRVSELGGIGFDKEKTLGFVDYLSTEALESIDTFDRLSVGLNMTIENFFTFINRLLEEEVPDKRDEDDFDEEDTLTVAQLGQLFGGVNDSAVDYILDTLQVDIYDVQEGFNTVDVIMVLMFVASHLEAGGIPLSILDIIAGFCDKEFYSFDADVWVNNIAASRKVPASKVKKLMDQLEGSLDDILTYVLEIVRMDTCELILLGGFPSAANKISPRMGGFKSGSAAFSSATTMDSRS